MKSCGETIAKALGGLLIAILLAIFIFAALFYSMVEVGGF